MIKKYGLICLIGAMTLSASSAYADDDWHMTISGKAWNSTWNGWSTINNSGTWSEAATATPLIVGVSAKHGNFFMGANYSPSTSYDRTAYGPGFGVDKRKESDLNIGYYFIPQIALTLGSKSIENSFSGQFNWKYKFVLLGINVNAPIIDTPAFMYGSFSTSLSGSAYVPAHAAGFSAQKPTYQAIEVGLGYAITNTLMGTVGYKYQQFDLKFDAFSAKTRDTTTGLIVGLSYQLF